MTKLRLCQPLAAVWLAAWAPSLNAMATEAPGAQAQSVAEKTSIVVQAQPPAVRADDAVTAAKTSSNSAGLTPRPDLEGAIGPVLSWGPDYAGGSTYRLGVQPGFFVRYRRLTISNASSFSSVRLGEVSRGLGLDFSPSDTLRASVGLRLDRGRQSSKVDALGGIDNVRSTLRVRAAITKQLGGGWKIGAGLSADAMGRGGGQVIDAGVTHDRRLSPDLTWSADVGLSAASAAYMRSYYGITPTEAAASGYRAYTPGAGLRDLSAGSMFRLELDPVWTAFWGVSVSRLFGPASDSPLTTSAAEWSTRGGVARRF